MGIPSFPIKEAEAGLILRAKAGEAKAFGALYDRYHAQIYRFVLLKSSNKEDAEDLTHQIFLKAYENVASYEDRGFPFSSWLYQIARNRLTDYYRTAKHEVSLEDTDPEYFVGTASVSNMVDMGIEMEKVKEAIGSLKPDYQDVVIMRFVEELSLQETAEAVGKTVGAIKLIQYRALQELKKKLS